MAQWCYVKYGHSGTGMEPLACNLDCHCDSLHDSIRERALANMVEATKEQTLKATLNLQDVTTELGRVEHARMSEERKAVKRDYLTEVQGVRQAQVDALTAFTKVLEGVESAGVDIADGEGTLMLQLNEWVLPEEEEDEEEDEEEEEEEEGEDGEEGEDAEPKPKKERRRWGQVHSEHNRGCAKHAGNLKKYATDVLKHNETYTLMRCDPPPPPPEPEEEEGEDGEEKSPRSPRPDDEAAPEPPPPVKLCFEYPGEPRTFEAFKAAAEGGEGDDGKSPRG